MKEQAEQPFLPWPLLHLVTPLLASCPPAPVAILLMWQLSPAKQLLDVFAPLEGRLGHVGKNSSKALVPGHHLLVVILQHSFQGRTGPAIILHYQSVLPAAIYYTPNHLLKGLLPRHCSCPGDAGQDDVLLVLPSPKLLGQLVELILCCCLSATNTADPESKAVD